jgi:hypothetical protein
MMSKKAKVMYILSLLCIFLLGARSAQPLEALILEKWVVKNYPFQGCSVGYPSLDPEVVPESDFLSRYYEMGN